MPEDSTIAFSSGVSLQNVPLSRYFFSSFIHFIALNVLPFMIWNQSLTRIWHVGEVDGKRVVDVQISSVLRCFVSNLSLLPCLYILICAQWFMAKFRCVFALRCSGTTCWWWTHQSILILLLPPPVRILSLGRCTVVAEKRVQNPSGSWKDDNVLVDTT